MYCSTCGSALGKNDLFCAKCGAATSNADAQVPQESRDQTATLGSGPKQLSRPVFVALILASTFVVAILLSEKGVGTVLLSALVAETLAGTAVGFSLAKLVTKNGRRTWIEILLFQVVNIAAGLISAGASGPMKTALAIGFTFIASTLVLWFQRRSASAGLWAKSIAECEGDEALAKAAYLRCRTAELRAAGPMRAANQPAVHVAVGAPATHLESLARFVLQNDSLQHAEQLARALGYKVSEVGGSWITSPSLHVLPPQGTDSSPVVFETWEPFQAWVRRVLCPPLLAAHGAGETY